MTRDLKEKKRRLIKDFRYGIIAELVNPYLKSQEFVELLNAKAAREYEIPYSKKTTITAAAIRLWIKNYKEHGENGLLPRIRKDAGTPKSFTSKEQNILLTYLEEHPEVPASTAVKVLLKEGEIRTNISQSALSRFILANGITRVQRTIEKQNERHLKYQFERPLECVQSDAMHAFPVPFGADGKMKKAILIAFIDDATRRIVYSSFTHTERSYEFEKGIKHILKTHGHIGKLYTDNGSTFVSDQTKRILSIIGIPLIHSRPGKPAGRGKIERFFRTVRDQFLRPLDKNRVTGLPDLNIRFRTWLESEYHRNPHRGLGGQTPLECWMAKVTYIIQTNQNIDLDDVFLHEESRKIYKDNTFSLHGMLYEVPGMLALKKIKLRFDPVSTDPVMVYFEGKYIADARIVDSYANCRIVRNTHSKTITESQAQSAGPPRDNTHDIRIASSLSASHIGGKK